ncbi:Butyrophilin subfamily 1 member A1, partial [Chelonia mydas]
FTVTVHVDPAIALVGQGVMLSCQPGGHNPTNVQVHWYKWERSKNMTLYFYNSTENGTELGQVGDQHRSDSPRGRYENGVITVQLFPVQVEDSGQYVCAVTNDGVYQEAIAQVIVAGFGSAPRLTIDHQQNNSVTLRCTSQGWYPQPEVRWTDSTGQNITAMAETRIQKDVTDLYQIHSTLRVADIASDTISCTIRNPLLKRHRKKVIAISGFFDVEAEHDTITTVIGENAILPCRLITKHLPPSMELQWRKVGPGKDKLIYFYLYDESSPLVNSYPQSDKCPMSYLSPNGDNSREWLRKEYEKKAEVFKGKEFGKGNISLKLNNIQVEDEGKYVCSASANLFHREIIIEVLVIGRLRIEMDQLQSEREQLQRENAQLKEDNAQVKEDMDSERKEDHSQAEHLEEEMAQVKEDMGESLWCIFSSYSSLFWHYRSGSQKENSLPVDDITLDADTAHPNLSIAPNKKSLKHEAQPQKVPANAERFDSTVCVLGSEGFFSGKHYWEVEVVSSTDWDLGVARTSIQRKGKLSLSPKEGFWALGLSGRDYWAKTDPWTRVMVQKKPQKIGVYLSHQDRQVTFLNVTDMSVLFTFNDCSFSGEVYPFFKNSHKETTMRICSIKEE